MNYSNYKLPSNNLLNSSNNFFKEMIENIPVEEKEDNLYVVLGKEDNAIFRYIDVYKSGNIFIGGSTGTGKSVLLNNIICSILMKSKPNEVRLLLIDTKGLEFSFYNGIPHLLQPVVTDSKKASIALQRVVQEIERRFDLFIDSNVKNIDEYNKRIIDRNNSIEDNDILPLLSKIVVVIDELYDLMIVANKEIENSIMRIVEMSRITGIYIIISSQISSIKPISTILDLSILTRISFKTASKNDSLKIIGSVGAFNIDEIGECLITTLGEPKPKNIKCPMVSEDEILRLVDFVSKQQVAIYDDSSRTDIDKSSSTHSEIDKDDADNDDPLYNDVVEFVVNTKKASASSLQRKFKLNYNRAARLIDQLEERGIIGPQQGSKPREVLVELDNKK